LSWNEVAFMELTKCSSPTDKEIEQADKCGFRDGFTGSDKSAYRYIGRNVLISTYIMAKIKGAHENKK